MKHNGKGSMAGLDVPYGASQFPPIADYGFLSDCENMALVAPSGNVEWMCLPKIDSPSIFGSMLDRTAGGFRFGPADVSVPAARRYLPGTMVLETSWGTPTGWVIIRDVMLIGPWRHEDERSESQRRAPTDYDAEHILLRMVRCVNGEVQLTINCEPIFDYGRRLGSWEYSESGYRQVVCRPATNGAARRNAEPDGGEQEDIVLTLTSDINLGIEGPRALGRTLIKEGETKFCALSWGLNASPRTTEEAYGRLVWTAHHWQHWLARGTFPDHPWRGILQRSALTLKGLIYAPTGAVTAAATTSLPETPGGERNWDYRYTWIRDSTFALWGLYTLGFDWEAKDYVYFIAEVAERFERLPVMTTVDGGPVPDEQILAHLTGYGGAQPVRIGNGAFGQDQHDVWGAVLDSVYLHTKSTDHIDERVWPILVKLVDAALEHWREPDRGMWEVRGEPQHFTSSKLMCWVAADRGARLAELRGDQERTVRWRRAAEEIRADIIANALDKRGVFTQAYGTDALDASVLLMPLVRFLPRDDERIRNTVLAIADELTEDGLVLRYRTEETDDGLSGKEGAFTICSFWLVSALVEIGEVQQARRLCEKLIAMASDLGLYGEEIDPQTGRHLGNFPQAFTHLALINAVTHVIRAEAAGEHEAQPPTLSPSHHDEKHEEAGGNGKADRERRRIAHTGQREHH
jgi:GH15 family glucan-1,4-alpha-glucosidase